MNSNSTQVCRLCLDNSDGLVNIFENFQNSTIASVLAEHFWFQINKDDGMPEWVCEICWSQTRTFHNFYKRLELLHQNFLNSRVLVKVDEIKQERSVSPIEEAYEDDLFTDKCETDITIKTDDTQIPSNQYSCEEENSYDIGEQSEEEQTTDADDENSPDKPRRYNSQNLSEIEKQDAEIRRFFTMKCDLCSDVEFDTLKKVRKHYRQMHKTKGYLICCGNKYGKRCEILDHIQYHVNPDAHRCDQCGKIYKDRQTLRRHIKSHLRTTVHTCSLCPKTYSSAAMLRYHVRDKHSTDTSEKFPCEQCGKICRSKMSLAAHIKNVHEPSMNHVCEICGRTFKHKFNLQIHEQLEHSKTPLPKVQCNICGAWLKHEHRLGKHLTMHREMQEAQDGKVFNCPICKKVVQTKTLLTNHIRSTHGERKHQCTFCDKAFRSAKTLKEHIAALHTGADLYSCTYCDRTFKSNANMYSHRKKAHLEEWTRDKVEKDRCKQAAPSETQTIAGMVVDK